MFYFDLKKDWKSLLLLTICPIIIGFFVSVLHSRASDDFILSLDYVNSQGTPVRFDFVQDNGFELLPFVYHNTNTTHENFDSTQYYIGFVPKTLVSTSSSVPSNRFQWCSFVNGVYQNSFRRGGNWFRGIDSYGFPKTDFHYWLLINLDFSWSESSYPYVSDLLRDYPMVNSLIELDEMLYNGINPWERESTDYDSSIGYLSNMDKLYKEIVLEQLPHGASGGQTRDILYHFGWSSTSTTGLVLKSNSYENTMIQIAFEPIFDVTLANGDKYVPIHHGFKFYPNMLSGSSTVYEVKYSDLVEYVKEDFQDIKRINNNIVFDADIILNWNFYFRIVCKTGPITKYGGWVRMNPVSGFSQYGSSNGKFDIIFGSDDEQGNFTPDTESPFGSGQTIQGGYGSGTSWEDAEIDSGLVPEGFSSVEDILSMIGNMPKIIAALFSFLPPWVLTLYATGFALGMPIILYKLIRG